MEKLEVMTAEGRWFTLAEWYCHDAGYDASEWLDKFGYLVGTGTAPLPRFGFVNLRPYAAIR